MQAGPQRLVALVREALSRDDSDTRLPEIAPLPIEDEEAVTLRSHVYVADAAFVNDAVDVDANGGEQDHADTDGNGDNGDNGKNLYNGLVAGGTRRRRFFCRGRASLRVRRSPLAGPRPRAEPQPGATEGESERSLGMSCFM